MSQETAKMTMQEKTRAVYEQAPEVLAEFEAAYIFNSDAATRREFPKFDSSEMKVGELLGKGGFSGVREVLDIELQDDEATYGADEQKDKDKKTGLANALGNDHAHHYDVATAKTYMASHTQRLGSARYAIKRLKDDLDELQQARGALDLAIEIMLMSAFWHPNIVKMRGISNTPNNVSTETFIVMDRLYGTLNDKIETWHSDMAMLKGCCGITKKNPAYRDSLKARLLVAYDLSRAFEYLHSCRLVYRDVKPENIGFDIRGDVKIFDFGLCRSLEDRDKVKEGFKLTPKTGSVPYMAPEVVMSKPYDNSVDVFSFGILLWELLTLEWAFNGFSTKDFFIRVAKHGERPKLPTNAPPMTRSILPEAWDEDPSRRPTMKRIGAVIRSELEDIATDAEVVNRTQHMLNRSFHSQRGFSSNGRKKSSLTGSRNGRESFIGGDGFGSESGRSSK